MSTSDPRLPRSHARLRAGFTLIEVMAAVLLTAIVIGVAFSFQVQIGNATSSARNRVRAQRHAVGVLDRVARDLQGAYMLVKGEETDPFDHPWIFVGTDLQGSGSADAVKFITRNHRSHTLDGATSDLATVAYFLVEGPDEFGYQLMRWISPRLPDGFDATFPDPDDERSMLIAEDIAAFRFTFVSDDGAESSEWDSSGIDQADTMPLAVKIEISMLDPDTGRPFEFTRGSESDDSLDEGELDDEAPMLARTVLLPMRPIDFEVLQDEADETAQQFAAFFPEGAAELTGNNGDDPFSDSDSSSGDEDDEEAGCGPRGTAAQCAKRLIGDNVVKEEWVQQAYQQYGISPSTCVEDIDIPELSALCP